MLCASQRLDASEHARPTVPDQNASEELLIDRPRSAANFSGKSSSAQGRPHSNHRTHALVTLPGKSPVDLRHRFSSLSKTLITFDE